MKTCSDLSLRHFVVQTDAVSGNSELFHYLIVNFTFLLLIVIVLYFIFLLFICEMVIQALFIRFKS